jgi:ribonucleoside-triphosphate reductase
MSTKCSAEIEVYSRVCGFFRPVQQWNRGKKEEFRERAEYVVAREQKD